VQGDKGQSRVEKSNRPLGSAWFSRLKSGLSVCIARHFEEKRTVFEIERIFFSLGKRIAYSVSNPRTGAVIKIKAAKVLKFF
jgi:hypothetical protein